MKDVAHRVGADLVGVVGAEAWADWPEAERPTRIQPRCRAVVVVARRVLRGAFRGVEEGTETKHAFQSFGFLKHEDVFLSKTTYDLNIWMEARGFEAVPLFAYDCAGQPVGVPVAPGKPAPNVMLKYRTLAQAAGLGETGLHGLFLTPEFGVRQRFAMLLTDADLEADEPFKPHLCDDCGSCVKACPLGALDAAACAPSSLPGYERPVAARDNAPCRICQNGAVQTNEGRFNAVERMAAAWRSSASPRSPVSRMRPSACTR